MKLPYGLFFFAAVGIAVCATTGQASAQATRTWVSGVGDDANPCSRTAPCKTWAGAISKTIAGGEIDALDPGGFGALTITKAITLDGGGGQVASTLTSGTNGFNINAGAADVVILRNIRITGAGGAGNLGIDGIKFSTGAALIVENCNIFTFSEYGINFQPAAPAALLVRNTTIDNASQGGIWAATTSTSAYNHVTIENSTLRASNNGPGLNVGAYTYVQMNGGALSSNVKYGLVANGTNAFAVLDGVAVTNNYTGGVHGTNGGIAALTNSDITFNVGTGVVNDGGGQTATWGNNRLQYNRTAGGIETDGTFSQTNTQH
jgi:hypothetical protein